MEDDTISNFGGILKEFRKRRKITQQELAVRVGVHRNTIGTWEHGDFLPESKTLVLELAHQLHLDTNETRRLLEASLTSLSPYWHVPHQRNPFFTGRDAVLQQLRSMLHHEQTANLSQLYTLSGLGGIGKTQTAIEYAYRYSNEYMAIFWISAETYETIVSSMVAIADLLNLPEKQEQDQEKVVMAISRWLTNHSDWLLILDNMEDPTLIKGILPSTRRGHLLFTSRRHALGLGTQTLDLEPMIQEEGVHLLLCRARLLDPMAALDSVSPTDLAVAREIVNELDGLPLALDQAGAYIEASQCSLADYLQIFQFSRVRLLDERDAHADHPLSVTRTFALAFERLEQENSNAAALLTVCAFLASEAIPETFFIEGAIYLGSAFEMMAADPFTFHNAMKMLLSYSLLQRISLNHTVTIHRLVQVVLKERLSEATQRSWSRKIITAMTNLFPLDEYTHPEYWQTSERLLSHALACLATIEQWDGDEALYLPLMNSVATYLFNHIRYIEAETLFESAVQVGETVLGLNHPLLADALHGLANVYQAQVKYEQAENLYRRALRIREQELGVEHLLVATSLNKLGNLYYDQGKYAQAEPLYQRALHIREQALEPLHPLVAQILNNQGNLYGEQGKYAQAEPLYRQAIQIWEHALGADSPQIAGPFLNLGLLYHEQGKYAQAEDLYLRAVRNWEQALGPDYSNISYPLTNLADAYREQGKYAQAEPLYQRALHIREQALGPDHLSMADPLNGLANLYREQKKYAQAEPLYQRALALRRQHLGPQHPFFAETLHHVARFRQAQQQTTEALSLYQQALAIRAQVLGPDHPKTVETRNAIVSLMQEMEHGKKTLESQQNHL